MIIVYVNRLEGKKADVIYNSVEKGLGALAEISFGFIVTCTFSLLKFIESKGTKLRRTFSSLTRSFASVVSFEASSQSVNNTNSSHEKTLVLKSDCDDEMQHNPINN